MPRDALDSVTALYMQGHAPDVSVVDMIPNVRRVYSTYWCFGCPAYHAVCEKNGHGPEARKPRPWPEMDEGYWDTDDEEFVNTVHGDSPRLESDAPTRTD